MDAVVPQRDARANGGATMLFDVLELLCVCVRVMFSIKHFGKHWQAVQIILSQRKKNRVADLSEKLANCCNFHFEAFRMLESGSE